MLARRVTPLALAVSAILLASACSSTTSTDPESPAGQIAVAAAFYPLQYAVEQIGGDHVHVMPLTRPGTEPHELELTPREVVGLHKAALVVYERGFQPAVDTAVDQLDKGVGFDVSPAAHLDLRATAQPGEAESSGGNGAKDPHFWLDPGRYAAVVTAVGAELAVKDPVHASTYSRNTTALVDRLTALDGDFLAGLKDCRLKDIVTGHAAFGYLAQRYGLTQVAVNGISPDAEPTAAAMADIVARIKEHHVSTVYAETLVSPALVDTIAHETGATVRVLDPVEGITSASAGTDYLRVMQANLATLRAGQQCP
ncbi:MAG: zinc ABC transporter substrate-binding protein [Nostocoides sp.]